MSSRQARIQAILEQHFTSQFLDLSNVSHQHQVPEGSESHFKLTLVATQFNGHNRIERHRMVNTLLLPEMNSGLHALSLALYSPEEWAKHPEQLQTPPCQHKKDLS
ncbi:MAG: BolA family transcriptional regulator [Legionellales bacterium]|nr:BolA family transcriptional regulator [Legionellales bacterium]